MRLKFYLFALFLSILVIGVAGAKMRPVKKLRAGLPPYSVIEQAVRTNDTVVTAAGKANGNVKEEQTPHMTWLADCDPRIQSTLFYAEPEEKILAVRNLGNQLILDQGSIDYGVNILLTPVLLITGNTDSQAIGLFIEGYSHLDPAISRDLDHLNLPLSPGRAAQPDSKITESDRRLQLIERNVDFQVDRALARYGQRVESGRLVVVGGVIDLDNSYGRGKKRLVVTNVNGEKDPERIKAMHHLTRLDKRLRALVGRKPLPMPAPVPAGKK